MLRGYCTAGPHSVMEITYSDLFIYFFPLNFFLKSQNLRLQCINLDTVNRLFNWNYLRSSIGVCISKVYWHSPANQNRVFTENMVWLKILIITTLTAKPHWKRSRRTALVSVQRLCNPIWLSTLHAAAAQSAALRSTLQCQFQHLFFLRAASDFVKLNRADQSRSYLTGSHTEKRHRESSQFSK